MTHTYDPTEHLDAEELGEDVIFEPLPSVVTPTPISIDSSEVAGEDVPLLTDASNTQTPAVEISSRSNTPTSVDEYTEITQRHVTAFVNRALDSGVIKISWHFVQSNSSSDWSVQRVLFLNRFSENVPIRPNAVVLRKILEHRANTTIQAGRWIWNLAKDSVLCLNSPRAGL